MDTPKAASQSQTRSIDDLISECDRLLQPDTFFSMNDLAKVQYDAVHCLLSLGSAFDIIRIKVEELRFNPIMEPLWRFVGQRIEPITRFRDKASFDEHITGVVNQLRSLMEIARERQQAVGAALASQTIPKKSAKPASLKKTRRHSPAKKSTRKKRRKELTPSEFRAHLVAKVIREIGIVRPQMYGESDYQSLAKEHNRYLIFRVARDHPDLREKLICVQEHRRYYRLAQEFVAAHTGKSLNTIKIDWKKHKPREFRSKVKL